MFKVRTFYTCTLKKIFYLFIYFLFTQSKFIFCTGLVTHENREIGSPFITRYLQVTVKFKYRFAHTYAKIVGLVITVY